MKNCKYLYIEDNGITRQYTLPDDMIDRLDVMLARKNKLGGRIFQLVMSDKIVPDKLKSLNQRASIAVTEYQDSLVKFAKKYPIRA